MQVSFKSSLLPAMLLVVAVGQAQAGDGSVRAVKDSIAVNPSSTAASAHPGGFQVVMGDGSARNSAPRRPGTPSNNLKQIALGAHAGPGGQGSDILLGSAGADRRDAGGANILMGDGSVRKGASGTT